MPLPKSKAARKAMLAQARPRAARVNHTNEYYDLAATQCGLIGVRILAPRTLAQVQNPEANPCKVKSLEYTERMRVSTRNDVFHPKLNPYGRRKTEDALREVREFEEWQQRRRKHEQRCANRYERQRFEEA